MLCTALSKPCLLFKWYAMTTSSDNNTMTTSSDNNTMTTSSDNKLHGIKEKREVFLPHVRTLRYVQVLPAGLAPRRLACQLFHSDMASCQVAPLPQTTASLTVLCRPLNLPHMDWGRFITSTEPSLHGTGPPPVEE